MQHHASAPTVAGSPGSNGTIRTCRGSVASCGSARSATTARWGANGGSPAVTTSRSSNRNGRPTAASILSPTAPSKGSRVAGGTCSGPRATGSSRSIRSRPRIRWAGRNTGISGCRQLPSGRRSFSSAATLENGVHRLSTVDPASLAARPIAAPFQDISSVRAVGGRVYFRGGSLPADPPGIVELDLGSGSSENALKRSTTQ